MRFVLLTIFLCFSTTAAINAKSIDITPMIDEQIEGDVIKVGTTRYMQLIEFRMKVIGHLVMLKNVDCFDGSSFVLLGAALPGEDFNILTDQFNELLNSDQELTMDNFQKIAEENKDIKFSTSGDEALNNEEYVARAFQNCKTLYPDLKLEWKQ